MPSGATVWHYALKAFGCCAARLRNGNTIVCFWPGMCVDEIDSGGKVVWEALLPNGIARVPPLLSLCSLGFDVHVSEHRDLSQDIDYQVKRLEKLDTLIRFRAHVPPVGLRSTGRASDIWADSHARRPQPAALRHGVSTLNAIGPAALPELMKASKHENVRVRANVLETISLFSFESRCPLHKTSRPGRT
jgi:hypothetical protein